MGYIAKDKEINLLHTEAERMYRRLVENLHIGIYMADAKGDLFYVNSAFVEMLGYQNRDEVLGLNLARNLYVDPTDRDTFLKRMERLGFVRDYIVKNKRKDGTTIILSVTSNFIRNDSGGIIGVEGVAEDITSRSLLEAEARMLTNAVSQTADHVMITDSKGAILYVNPAFEKTTGYAMVDVYGRSPRILRSGVHGKEYYDKLWSTLLSGNAFQAQTTNKNKYGKMYIADQTITPIKNEAGEITHFVSVWTDVTDKIRWEERLKNEKRKLEEIIGFDEKVSAIRKLDRLFDFVVKKASEILEANKCLLMLVDHAEGELNIKGAVGFPDDIFKRKIKVGESIAGRVAQSGQPLLVRGIEQEPQYEGGFSYLGNSFVCVPVKVNDHVIAVMTVAGKGEFGDEAFDETDLKILDAMGREVAVALDNLKLYKELHYLSITDPLTHLHNFRYFHRGLDYELKRIKRHPRPLAVMMIDVDNFKSYNDSFGHPEGSQLLMDIGKILKKDLREVDILCRYGGDEFAVVLPETGKDQAEAVAEKIRKAVQEAKFRHPVTVSIGIGMYTPNAGRYELTSKADRALYQAKHEGKNKVCVYG